MSWQGRCGWRRTITHAAQTLSEKTVRSSAFRRPGLAAPQPRKRGTPNSFLASRAAFPEPARASWLKLAASLRARRCHPGEFGHARGARGTARPAIPGRSRCFSGRLSGAKRCRAHKSKSLKRVETPFRRAAPATTRATSPRRSTPASRLVLQRQFGNFPSL